jgi:hypothetical protein
MMLEMTMDVRRASAAEPGDVLDAAVRIGAGPHRLIRDPAGCPAVPPPVEMLELFCCRVGMLGCSAAGGDARLFCCRVGMLGRSAAGRDSRPICRRSRCPAVLPPVEIRGQPLCHRWRCAAVLPPVEIRGQPLCRRF